MMPSGSSFGAAAHRGRWGESSLFWPSFKRDLTTYCLALPTRAAQGERAAAGAGWLVGRGYVVFFMHALFLFWDIDLILFYVASLQQNE